MEIRTTPNPNVRQFLPGGLVSPGGSIQRKRSECVPHKEHMEEKSWDKNSSDQSVLSESFADEIAREQIAEEEHPIFKELFQMSDVQEVFFGYDFLTVQGLPSSNWDVLSAYVVSILEKYEFPVVLVQSVLSQSDQEHAKSSKEFPRSSQENNGSEDGHVSLCHPTEGSGGNPMDDIIYEIKCLFEERVQPAVAMDGGEILFKAFKDGIVYVEMRGACSGCPQSSATLKGGIERLLQYYIPEVIEIRIEGEPPEQFEESVEDPLQALDAISLDDLSPTSLVQRGSSQNPQEFLSQQAQGQADKNHLFEPIINGEFHGDS